MNKRLFVVGHWMLDHIVILPHTTTLDAPLPPEHIQVDVISRIGGSGYHFAVGARKAGFHNVCAIMCSGRDMRSKELAVIAKNAGISVIQSSSSLACAQSVLLYDRKGHRSSFGTRGPNLEIPTAALHHLKRNTYDIVFVAGHLLEDKSSSAIVTTLIRTAKNSGAFVILDLVPHHIHKLFPESFFEDLFPYIDGIISRPVTISGILGEEYSSIPETQEAQLFALLKLFSWVCLHKTNDRLTIGIKGDSNDLVYEAETGYGEQKVKAGALDYPVARELFNFFSRNISRTPVRKEG